MKFLEFKAVIQIPSYLSYNLIELKDQKSNKKKKNNPISMISRRFNHFDTMFDEMDQRFENFKKFALERERRLFDESFPIMDTHTPIKSMFDTFNDEFFSKPKFPSLEMEKFFSDDFFMPPKNQIYERREQNIQENNQQNGQQQQVNSQSQEQPQQKRRYPIMQSSSYFYENINGKEQKKLQKVKMNEDGVKEVYQKYQNENGECFEKQRRFDANDKEIPIQIEDQQQKKINN